MIDHGGVLDGAPRIGRKPLPRVRAIIPTKSAPVAFFFEV
jgi:hypothetical protein